MCSPNETTSSKTATEQVSDATLSSHDESGASSSCCSGGKKCPKNGRDLGVFEKSLEDQANFFSRWTMSYLNPLFSLATRKVLDNDDIGVPSDQDLADRAYEGARLAWEEQVKQCEKQNEIIKQKRLEKLRRCKNDEQRAKIEAQPLKLKEPSISFALVRSFGSCSLILAIIFYILSSLVGFLPVLILNDLVRYFEYVSLGETEEPYETYLHPWIEVAGLGVFPLVTAILQTRHQAIMAHCGVFVRTAVSAMLYKKSLTVSAAGRAKTSTGQVVNMMSNDTMQLQRFLQFAGMTLLAPIQIIVALYLIFQQVGNATWVGVAYMVLLAPVNGWVFSVVARLRRDVLKFSDLRVKMMNEILTGIRVLKFYAWEGPFGKEVGRLRGNEMKALTKLSYTTAVGFSIILLSTPIIQPIIVFLTYIKIQNEPLSASTAFTTVALFNIMRFPFAFMPMGLLQYIQSKISLRRLERYLALPELVNYVLQEPHPDTTVDSPFYQPGSITIKDGNFSWIDPDAAPVKPIQDEKPKKERRQSRRRSSRKSKEDEEATEKESLTASLHSLHSAGSSGTAMSDESAKGNAITLQDINCQIEAGSLVACVGSVGSGKSSLLSAILGEMEPINNSKIYAPREEHQKGTNGVTAYCSQSPWVVNDTLRGNILFGREFDEERYEKVIKDCALSDDLAALPAGDMTEIGERGINLSGGQKARVALARALYSPSTQLLLMDDPLSAVDSHVGEHLFNKAIRGELSAGMTRILVTHHVHVLSRCDLVIMMEDGRIKHQGKYAELIAKGVDFAGAIDVSTSQTEQEDGKTDSATETKSETETKTSNHQHEGDAAKTKEGMEKRDGKLVSDEEKEEGDIDGSAYLRYIRAGGWGLFATVVVVSGIGRGFEIMSSFWLAFWTDSAFEAFISGSPLSDQRTSFYLGVYAMFGFMGIVGLGVRGIFLAKHRLGASVTLHDRLTDTILRAPIAFFDVTPIGRILNRFAADMDKLDLELTQTISQGISTTFTILGSLAAIIAATKGAFGIPLIPIGYLYYCIQKWFRKTSTELQRIASIANSPIFADFSQTLSGTPSIRAYGVQDGFFKKCKSSFDNMNASYLLVQLVGYWLSLRLDLLGGFMAMFTGLVAVATLDYGFIPAGWLGLGLTYAIETTGYLKYGVQMIARLEADMSSVERILYYTDNVEAEAPAKVPEKDPSLTEWPTKGEIEFQNASMRYRDGPLVLKQLSLTVRGGEKLGVCGRTGSGKSSLMVSLFRISEIENGETTTCPGGKILIDGVNTREIGTEALRLSLSIIPQDPVMFSNTIRYNLDPFATAAEEDLWNVLKKVRMAEVIAALPRGLDEEVAEGGENFSQGQRQLICIARSLLRKPKILVLDEATASIDNDTDALIQQMIRENFQDSTVLTIAHRLNTIMDSDRILVLHNGEIAELDTPGALLAKENGHFKKMVEKSREATTETSLFD